MEEGAIQIAFRLFSPQHVSLPVCVCVCVFTGFFYESVRLTCCLSTQPFMPQPAFGMILDLVKLAHILPSLIFSHFIFAPTSSQLPPPLP